MYSAQKTQLMTRLAVLEKLHGRQIKRARKLYKIDLVTNPVWRRCLIATVLFWGAAGAWAVLRIDAVLDAIAADQARNLLMVVLIAYGMIMMITAALTLALSVRSAGRDRYYYERWKDLSEKLLRMTKRDERRSAAKPERDERRNAVKSESDDWWLDDDPDAAPGMRQAADSGEEPPADGSGHTLKFEDEEYVYYVRAIPKKKKRGRSS